MSRGWTSAKKILATVALAAFGTFAIGCGPAPGYEPEPRMPVGYAPAPAEPLTAEELQAQNEARAQAAGEIAVGADADEYADTDPSALTEFKPALEGHGEWVDDATYGTVWVPSEAEVGTDFTPYTTAGHWTYDDSTSWVWVSDYSWGWAPFHYGRWVRAPRHGWAWIPGRTYAGAWVTWRSSPGYGYVGWAPMGPDWYWYNGYAMGWNHGYTPYYSYCHHDHLYSPGVSHHVVRGPAGAEHEGRTQPYVGANPGVAGGGRVAATPTVGGAGRIAANPTVGARTSANPRVGGPRPTELGIKNESVVAPPADNAGLAKARVFASPQSAVAQGAAPPAGLRTRPATEVAPVAVAPRPSYDSRGPVTSRYDAVARAPQVQGVAPVPPRQAALPETRPSPRTFATTPGYVSPSSNPSIAQAPAYRVQPSQPAFGPQAPAYRAPSPSVSSPSSSFRSSPSISSSPSFRSSSPSISSSPSSSFRSSPSPSFRSSPPPSVRSAPSTPAFRSSPSVRSAPAPRVSAPSAPSRSSGAAIRSRR